MRVKAMLSALLLVVAVPAFAQAAPKMPVPSAPGARTPPPPRTKIDSKSDLSQQMQMRLQMYSDRRSKAYEALSNIQKKSSQTDNALIKNMK